WITAFFPYFKNWETGLATKRNPWLTEGGSILEEVLYPPEAQDPCGMENGPTTTMFPSGLAKAPFAWKYLTQTFNMVFLGGFVGVRQEAKTLRLRPEIGWAVREAPTK
ncbi:MAG: DUF4419 domain-containing protein, partial [Planctomycetales bacterium]